MSYAFNPNLKVQYMIVYTQGGIKRKAYFPTSILAMAFRQRVLAYRSIDGSRPSYPLRITS